MVPGSKSREGDLTTSSTEQRTRTFDVAPGARSGIAGPAPGDVLKNRFVLHQCLADGSTSRLFRALDRRREAAGDPDPWVVLKVVSAPTGQASGEREPRALQALRREAAIGLGLDHPNLPRIVGIDHDGPHNFMCMAWIEGESLAAILDSRGTRPMTRVQALHIVEGAGRALIHLHAQGITHVDVKPGNILVTAQGDATLLDFGVALGPGAGDRPAVLGFTPEYASPDVLAGSTPTPSDDLFSLACVAYRMLGGHRAFGTATAREAAANGSRPRRLDQLSPAQWRALDRALCFARAERQPDVATFLAQLKGARDESLAVTDLPPAEPERMPAAVAGSAAVIRLSHIPVRPAAVLVAMVVLGVLGAAWLLRAPDLTPALPPEEVEAAPAGPDVMASGQLSPLRAAEIAPPPAPAMPVPTPAQRRAQPAATAAPRDTVATSKPKTVPKPRNRPPAQPLKLAGPAVPEPAAAPTAPPSPATTPLAGATAGMPAERPVPFSALTMRRYVEPDYPRNAAARRISGWVDVAFAVEASGRTRDVRVVGADPPGVFDEVALAAVRRWRFEAMPEAGGTEAAAGLVTSQIRVRFDPR